MIELKNEFDCILGIPWLARYKPQINLLARSMSTRHQFAVSDVFTHFLVSSGDWPNVAVLDRASTTQVAHRASDVPICTACAVLINAGNDFTSPCSEEYAADEQWLPRKDDADDQRVPR